MVEARRSTDCDWLRTVLLSNRIRQPAVHGQLWARPFYHWASRASWRRVVPRRRLFPAPVCLFLPSGTV